MAFKIFDTIPKKLAIPVFVLFAVGWIVYAVGFGLGLNDQLVLFTGPGSIPINRNPAYFPFYFTLVGGPFVIVFGLVHAALPSSSAVVEAIVGAVSTILNNAYFISTGYTAVYSSILFQLLLDERNLGRFGDILNLMFAGAIILIVSLGVIQLLVIFYRKQPEQQQIQTKSWYFHISKFILASFNTQQLGTGPEPLKCSITELLRLLSIPAVICCVIGYGVYARGLLIIIGDSPSKIFSNFASWVSLTVPPFAFFIALLQAGSSQNGGTNLAILVSILNTFMVTCAGFIVTYIGQVIHLVLSGLLSVPDPPEEYELAFGGGITCLFFWTVLLVLSRFYTFSTDSMQTGNTSTSTTAGQGPSDQRQPTHLYVDTPFMTTAAQTKAQSELKEPPSYEEASSTSL